ncbi:MAG: cysteine synthase family protein [Bacteroidota bacterium]
MTQFTGKIEQALLQRLHQVRKLVGLTPLYKINNVYSKPGVSIYAKLEWYQLGGSVKSRPAFNIINQAIRSGALNRKKRLLDATSGNTGIAYAAIGAALGIPVTLCLPENASAERKQILRALGVELIYTSRFDLTDGAQLKAKALYAENPLLYYYADQYANENNWLAHYNGTALEIWEQTTGTVTHFIAGLGTTGTFTGTGRRLKELNPAVQLIGLQPDGPMHSLEGWKHLETAFVPPIYDPQLADQIREVDSYEALDLVKAVAQKEGLLISPSAAANLLGAIQLAGQIDEGVIVTTFADNAEKYSEVLQHLFQ